MLAISKGRDLVLHAGVALMPQPPPRLSAPERNELTSVEMDAFATAELMKNPGLGPTQPAKPNTNAPDAARLVHFLQRENLMSHSFEKRWLGPGIHIHLAIHFDSDRRKAALSNGPSENRRRNGFAPIKGDHASPRSPSQLM